jgi:opacity protein-like surface antigen
VLGDLDGDTAIVDDATAPTQFVFLPDIDASAGYGAQIGYRWYVWEVFLGYSITEYDADFAGAGMDTEITYLDLMFKHYFRPDSNVQPYLMGGIGWSEGEIDNGAVDTNPVIPTIGTADLKNGVNYNVGGGVSLFPLPWLSVYFQGMWRFGRFDEVRGPFGSTLVSGSIDSDAWEVSTGANIRILRPRS